MPGIRAFCAPGLARIFPASARLRPVFFALPLVAMAVPPVQGGGSELAAREADAPPAAQRSQEPPSAKKTQYPPAGRDAMKPPHEVHPEAREAISKIRSPFCPGQMLEVCPSSDAAILRDSLDQMAARGLPADSMVELVVKAYGEEYRALPKRSGTGLLAWVMPPAALIAGLGLVVLALRRLKGPSPDRRGEGLTDEERDRLDAALAEFEETEELE